jgi:hypothetical protein
MVWYKDTAVRTRPRSDSRGARRARAGRYSDSLKGDTTGVVIREKSIRGGARSHKLVKFCIILVVKVDTRSPGLSQYVTFSHARVQRINFDGLDGFRAYKTIV